MARQPGFTQQVTFNPGSGAVTLAVTSCSWQEEVEDIIVTGSTDAGVQARIAGVLEGGGTVEAVMDNTAMPQSAAGGTIVAGTKAILTFTAGGFTPFSIPLMVKNVRHQFGVKGAYTWSMEVGLDKLTGTYTRAANS